MQEAIKCLGNAIGSVATVLDQQLTKNKDDVVTSSSLDL